MGSMEKHITAKEHQKCYLMLLPQEKSFDQNGIMPRRKRYTITSYHNVEYETKQITTHNADRPVTRITKNMVTGAAQMDGACM
jgi:translation elongation factor EF-Tu-like GTPase